MKLNGGDLDVRVWIRTSNEIALIGKNCKDKCILERFMEDLKNQNWMNVY